MDKAEKRIQLQIRRMTDAITKSAVLSAEKSAGRFGLRREYELFRRLERKGLIICKNSPEQPGFKSLFAGLGEMDYSLRRKICLSLCRLFEEIEREEAMIRPGALDTRAIFYRAEPSDMGDVGDVCLVNAINMQIGPMIHTWEMTTEDECLFEGGHPLEPMTEDEQNLVYLRLMFRVLAGENDIPGDWRECLKRYKVPREMVEMISKDGCSKITTIGSMLSQCEYNDYAESEPSERVTEETEDDPVEIVYCLVPTRSEQDHLQGIRFAQKAAKAHVAELIGRAEVVNETFIMPGNCDQVYCTPGLPYNPARLMDVPVDMERCNYPVRAISFAMAVISQMRSDARSYLYLIGSDFSPNNSVCGTLLVPSLKKTILDILGERGTLCVVGQDGIITYETD